MFTRIAAAGVLMCAMLGCAKKTPKVAQNTDDTAPPPATPQQPEVRPKVNDRGNKSTADKTGKPNWLKDDRFKKDTPLPVDAAKKPDFGIAPLPGVTPGKDGPPLGVGDQPGRPPVPMVAPMPAVPMPAPMPPATTPAAQRVTKDDINDVWIFIENFSLAGGKMPGPDVVYAALIKAGSPAASMVKDGSIVLSGARGREGIWAFEKNAPTAGGWICSQNGPEQVTAAEFATRVKR